MGRAGRVSPRALHHSPSSQAPSGLRAFCPLCVLALLHLRAPPWRFGLDVTPPCTHYVLGPGPDIFIFGPHNTPEGATAIPADRSSRVREGRVGQSSRWEVGEHTDTQCLLPSDTEGKVSLGPFSSEALRLLPMQNRDVTQ